MLSTTQTHWQIRRVTRSASQQSFNESTKHEMAALTAAITIAFTESGHLEILLGLADFIGFGTQLHMLWTAPTDWSRWLP